MWWLILTIAGALGYSAGLAVLLADNKWGLLLALVSVGNRLRDPAVPALEKTPVTASVSTVHSRIEVVMKTGTVITAVAVLVLVLVVLVYPSPVGLVLSVAGVVVGFLVLTFQGYRLRSKEGWKPIASQSGVHRDAQFAVLILIPLIVLLVGVAAAILQIRALVLERDSSSWGLLALSLGLIAGALVLFAYLRKVRRNEARGTHEDT